MQQRQEQEHREAVLQTCPQQFSTFSLHQPALAGVAGTAVSGAFVPVHCHWCSHMLPPSSCPPLKGCLPVSHACSSFPAPAAPAGRRCSHPPIRGSAGHAPGGACAALGSSRAGCCRCVWAGRLAGAGRGSSEAAAAAVGAANWHVRLRLSWPPFFRSLSCSQVHFWVSWLACLRLVTCACPPLTVLACCLICLFRFVTPIKDARYRLAESSEQWHSRWHGDGCYNRRFSTSGHTSKAQNRLGSCLNSGRVHFVVCCRCGGHSSRASVKIRLPSGPVLGPAIRCTSR